ncbi:ABC transporter permease [Phototrophicus methaneseepsis]|uniref:ABC transporter permease n=1 Tax=Phototrophicus methaneseepsis TaxID=2710758 RepID=A0A7S8EDQ6_9CHLR|nr:nickel transporter permease [Phototrophicus methaneseepsis]QPC84964.1 ABC transporter permease [Phototrophicus methaneseepsis]
MSQQEQSSNSVGQLESEARSTALHTRILRKFFNNYVAVLCSVALIAFIVAILVAPLITPYDPIERSTPERNQPPSVAHLMGTDTLGRDILSRVLYGGRISLQVGFFSVALALAVGMPLGLLAGFSGGWVDNAIMRMMDVILAFPGLILAIWLVSLLGSNIINVILAIAFFSIPTYARLVRGLTLSIREMDYVIAARSMGAGSLRLMFNHILPGVVGSMIVVTTLDVSGAIITGASLSFLGLGVSPPTPEWGAMLADGRSYLRTQWWMAVFPGLAITFVVLMLNIIGDAVRDALDPNVRE